MLHGLRGLPKIHTRVGFADVPLDEWFQLTRPHTLVG